MRRSCREDGVLGLNGYFRGVRDFFPEGTFEDVDLSVRPDPLFWRDDGLGELLRSIEIARENIARLLIEADKLRNMLHKSRDGSSGYHYFQNLFLARLVKVETEIEDLKKVKLELESYR